MKSKTQTHVSEIKKDTVKELSNLLKNKKTVLIASIKNLPGSQFQEISKKLRGKAIVKVLKKNLIIRAIDSANGEEIKKLKEQVSDSVAVLFSDLDSFDLASELIKNKSRSKAKAGQIAPFDIEVQAGPTDLVPGPAISELGSVGLQVQVEGGKLTIRESRVIVKEGAKISQNAADVMSKLDIKPFSIGFIPVSAFDTKENKLYLEIKIDPEKTLKDLKSAFVKALSFAVGIGYTSKETIGLLLAKAASHERRLKKIITGEPDEVVPASKEIKKEAHKEEKKADAAEGLASCLDKMAEQLISITTQDPIEFIISYYNGLKEINQRKEVYDNILHKLKEIEVDEYSQIGLNEKRLIGKTICGLLEVIEENCTQEISLRKDKIEMDKIYHIQQKNVGGNK